MVSPFSFINTAIKSVAFYHSDAGGDVVAVTACVATDTVDRALFGQGQYCGKSRCFDAGQVFRAFLVVAVRPCLGSIGADACFCDVQIDFHDAAFAPDGFDQKCEIHFRHFAEVTGPATALPEKYIFGGLLADGRSAAYPPAAFVALKGLFDGFAVKSVMAAEFAIFGGYDGTHQIGGNVGQPRPVPRRAIAVEQHGEGGWYRDNSVHRGQRDAADHEI